MVEDYIRVEPVMGLTDTYCKECRVHLYGKNEDVYVIKGPVTLYCCTECAKRRGWRW